MLKRQRPSSPLPHSMDCTVEAIEGPEDLYEPDRKRRRYFTPSEADKLSWRDVDADENVEVQAGAGAGFPRPTEGRYKGANEWQRQAGEYKTTNTLLHDLHAQQRHRIIFASPLIPYTPLTDGILSTRAQEEEDASYHGVGVISMHASNTREPNTEAKLVSQRYEDTNKLLGSLVLNRRRQLDSSPSQASTFFSSS